MADIDRWAFKIILIGPASVGKTSILTRFIQGKFKETYEYTMGVDYLSKEVEFTDPTSNRKNMARLTIWDIGGQERFKFLRNTFYKGANGAIIVFDLTRADTFKEIPEWIYEMEELVGKKIPYILAGNKTDLLEEVGRIIDEKEIKDFIEKEKCLYIETSAKTGENIEKTFKELCLLMANLKKPEEIEEQIIRDQILQEMEDLLPNNPIEAQGMLIKAFYRKFGKEALPIIKILLNKQGKAIGLKVKNKLKDNRLSVVGEFFTKSWDPKDVKIIELSDNIFRIRGFKCPFGLENTSRELCEAVMEIDKEYFRTAVNEKINFNIIKTLAAGDEFCETLYFLEHHGKK
ncbi:MAG: GTP-binding protein [Promethearchaeota archaeon]